MNIKQIKVKNFQGESGAIPNQFIIKINDDYVYFQSYESIIAKKDYNTGEITLDPIYWDYSKTTGKYRNIFLNEPKALTEKKIKLGEYKLENLN